MNKALILKKCNDICPEINDELNDNGVECNYVETEIDAAKAILDDYYKFIICCADTPDDSLDALRWLKNCTVIPFSSRVIAFTKGVEREHIKSALQVGVAEFYDVLKQSNYQEIFGRQETFYPSNILLVEDDKAIAALLIQTLESHGHTVTHHVSATAAHRAVLQGEYDLVVTDLLLEGKQTGYDLINYLKRNQHLDKLPALVITGYSNPAVIVDLLSMGVSDVSVKPIIPEEFLLRVEQILKTKYYRDQLEAQSKKLLAISLVDPLTGAFNRRFMDDALAQKVNDLQRKGYSFSVLLIDIDDFKKINDTQGHLVGDKSLKLMTNLIKNEIRNVDSFCRFGGEEFVLILSDCGELNVMTKAESICKKVAEELDFTISIGVAVMTKENKDVNADSILQGADSALYKAKHNGKNQAVLAGL